MRGIQAEISDRLDLTEAAQNLGENSLFKQASSNRNLPGNTQNFARRMIYTELQGLHREISVT